jgi:Zn-dependent protease with chaperone function
MIERAASVLALDSLGWSLLHSLWLILGVYIAHLVLRVLLRRHAAQVQYVAACAALAAATLLPAVLFAGLRLDAFGLQTIQTRLLPSGVYSLPKISTQIWWLGATAWLEQLLSLLALVWAACVGLRFAATGRALRAVNRLVGSAQAASFAGWDRLRDALVPGRDVRLLESAAVAGPATVGWRRPVVIVPLGLLSGLNAAEVEAILAHELAHIRRADYIVNLLQTVAEAVYFYHPCVWLIGRDLTYLRETYGHALDAADSYRPAVRLAMALSGGSLVDRVNRLVALQQRPPRNSYARLAAAGCVLLILSAAGANAASKFAQGRGIVPPQSTSLAAAVYDLLGANRPNDRFVPAVAEGVALFRRNKALTYEQCMRLANEVNIGAPPDALLNELRREKASRGETITEADVTRRGGTEWHNLARELIRHRTERATGIDRITLTRAAVLISAQENILPGPGFLQRVVVDVDQASLDALVPNGASRLLVIMSFYESRHLEQMAALERWKAAVVAGEAAGSGPAIDHPSPCLQTRIASFRHRIGAESQ